MEPLEEPKPLDFAFDLKLPDFDAPKPLAERLVFVEEREPKLFIDPLRLDSELDLALATELLPAANFEFALEADLML